MQRLLPLQPGVAQSYDLLMTSDINNSDQMRNINYRNKHARSVSHSETLTSSTVATSTALDGNSSSLDMSKLLELSESHNGNPDEKQLTDEENNCDDAQNIINDPGIQSLLDISLSSPISISNRDDACSYSDFTDSNSQPSMSPMRILRELPSPADAKWFEENMHDFSLSSFLGHLEQQPSDQNIRRIKSPSRNVNNNKFK